MTTPRRSKTLTFSLPPEMEAQVRLVMNEDDLSVSELLRQAIRLFMEEREWRRRERLERLRSRQNELGRDKEDRLMNDRLDRTPVALYARVSSDRQDVDLSVAAQLRALRDYAEKNDYLVCREYVDEAESGRIADRPQFQKMLDAAGKPEAPFKEILVWKFSRFTRKREHAVAFKSMLRRRGIRVVSITEQAEDTASGRLLEAIIEGVDEFYSENLAQEVTRGMREAASRGFWMTTYAPYGYKRVHVQDGPKKRPKLELNPPADAVVRRIFDMALQGKEHPRHRQDPQRRGHPHLQRQEVAQDHRPLRAHQRGVRRDRGLGRKRPRTARPPCVSRTHTPASSPKQEFRRIARMMESRAPKKVNPRRISSPYLLSGIAKCETCGKAMTAAEAKSGKYTYYICHSLLKRGKGTCKTPRLNAKKFEKIIVDELRANILTESNIRDLVKLLDEEMDGVARDQRERLESIDGELEEVKKQLGPRLALHSKERQRGRGRGFGPHRGTPGAQGDP